MSSLRDYLTTRNPDITARHSSIPISDGRNKKSISKRNTENRAYSAPCRVQRWREFNGATLSKMYPELLQEEVHLSDFFPIRPAFREVWNEASVQNIVHKWNANVVCEALEKTKGLLKHEECIYMELACHTRPVDSGPSSRPFFPDWAAIRMKDEGESGQDEAPQSILPGDTKISTTWNPDEIEEGYCRLPPNRRPQWFKPLAQIFSYCHRLRARYGYLITDKALVVVRIGPDINAPSKNGPHTVEEETDNNGRLEFATVKWAHGKSNSGSLTINLALWWLHLLAAKDNSLQWKYPPLRVEVLHEREQPADPDANSQQTDIVTEPDAHIQDEPTDGDAGFQQTSFDTEPNTPSGEEPLESRDDNYVTSFHPNPSGSVDDSSVPEATSVLGKRQQPDEQQEETKRPRRRKSIGKGG